MTAAIDFSEVLEQLFAPRERWPLLRVGSRDYISIVTRRLVYERDGFACMQCGSGEDLQLDHIVPWSSNGPDWSENLRTLCATCNGDRSNYHEPIIPRRLPVTECCWPCSLDPDPEDDYEAEPQDEEKVAAYCGRCGLTSWVFDWKWLL